MLSLLNVLSFSNSCILISVVIHNNVTLSLAPYFVINLSSPKMSCKDKKTRRTFLVILAHRDHGLDDFDWMDNVVEAGSSKKGRYPWVSAKVCRSK
jgi:hypothetical protein